MDFGIFSCGDKNDLNTSNRRKRDNKLSAPAAITARELQANIIVISVVENRAREVCISKIDTSAGSTIEVYLHVDGHSYSETLSLIDDLEPDEILLHDGSRTRVLSKKIEEAFVSREESYPSVLYISRQYFDQDKGAEMLKNVLTGSVDADLIAKYTVLAGTYCLLKYIENCEGVNFAQRSLRLQYCNSNNGKLSIDRRSSINLELISNAKCGSQKLSLFGSINHTATIPGARFLKANILRPSTDIVTIDTRLDIVEMLISHNKVSVEIVKLLKQFPDLDKMLSGLTSVPKQITMKTARQGIDTLIYLKHTLGLVPSLADQLLQLRALTKDQTCGHAVLIDTLIENTSVTCFAELKGLIEGAITDSTCFTKSSHEMRYQECFALRPGIDGLLDIARKSFLQCVEDVHSQAENYSKNFNMSVKVSFSSSRGYYLTIPSDVDPLPALFTQAVLNKKTISCSTTEITSLADRASDAIKQALTLTHELIQSLMEKVRCQIDVLFSLTDSIALIDMLGAFANLVTNSPHTFTRPLLTVSGPLVISAGRHVTISENNFQKSTSSFVANDTFIGPPNTFQVITGPNGSGKTVFIKQVALIVILAQIGCYVPARHATIPIRDRILTRLGTSDDMEHNLSSFMSEMKEGAYVLNNVTPNSLVLIDELGRGTSNIDGLALAFSFSESLIDSSAYCLFVTHYTEITALGSMYPNCSNIHLKIALARTNDGSSAIGGNPYTVADFNNNDCVVRFTHRVASGPCEIKNGYGILMSELCGFPAAFVAEARTIQTAVQNLFQVLVNSTQVNPSVGVVTSLLQHLMLLKNSTLNDASLRQYLSNLRGKIPENLALSILRYVAQWENLPTICAKESIRVTGVDNQQGPADSIFFHDCGDEVVDCGSTRGFILAADHVLLTEGPIVTPVKKMKVGSQAEANSAAAIIKTGEISSPLPLVKDGNRLLISDFNQVI